jgi:hypothetical protein
MRIEIPNRNFQLAKRMKSCGSDGGEELLRAFVFRLFPAVTAANVDRLNFVMTAELFSQKNGAIQTPAIEDPEWPTEFAVRERSGW